MVAPATKPLPANEPQGPRPALVVAANALGKSVHANLACTDCHAEAKSLPHPAKLTRVACASCHAAAKTDFLQGAHAEAAAKGMTNAPNCVTCHGGHDILPKNNRDARTFPLNIVKICGDCHQKFTTSDGLSGKQHIANYLESVHGRAVSKGGLAVAATCADCHGNHRVLRSGDVQSSVNRKNVASTCGRCHVGLSEMYAASVHGEKLASGDPNAPVCTDCHTAHAITRTDTPTFMLDIVNECGQCHNKPIPGSTSRATLYQTYRRSYHGQVTQLGFDRAARCSSCHGAHDIKRLDDPQSRLATSTGARVATCKACHPDANASFAQFQPHADYRDAHRFPVLHGVWLYFIIVMSGAFGFFGLHSLLWFLRSWIDRIKHGVQKKHNGGPAIQRFNRVDRINHALVIISFFGLTVTGLPLIFADHRWARVLAAMLGGVNSAGILHRIFAIMLIANFVIHGFGLANRIRKHGVRKLLFGPATMLPRWKDITDCLGMFRWFFAGGRKPAFDRWTYWEKFDYVAEVGGSFIIALSGLMLWFPQFFAKFLPGWMFNVATMVHGYEALLAIGFIFTIHFFNAHLRMEKFPVDDVIFTGRLPEDEFREERGTEYARLAASGELQPLRVPPAAKGYRTFAIILGIAAMVIGTTLVVLIVLAGLGWIS
jgi:cytochrome b subunit of formate dehydrogenase